MELPKTMRHRTVLCMPVNVAEMISLTFLEKLFIINFPIIGLAITSHIRNSRFLLGEQ